MIKFILCSNNIVDNNYSNTEIKIKDAAKSLFLKKGYSATTTRDIARESDINLAMLKDCKTKLETTMLGLSLCMKQMPVFNKK